MSARTLHGPLLPTALRGFRSTSSKVTVSTVPPNLGPLSGIVPWASLQARAMSGLGPSTDERRSYHLD